MSPLYHVFNHSTQGPPTDGSTIFAVSQCSTGCSNLTILSQVVLNWTDIPTFTLDVNANANNQAQTWKFAFLACRPNVVIQTREVVSNGTGFLEVLPVRQGKQYISQGNLHPTQTPLMLSFALSGITSSAGPMNVSSPSAGSFSPVQNDFLFGREQIDALPQPTFDGQPIVVTILPTDTLAKTFAGMLQSVSKSAQTEFDVSHHTLTLLHSISCGLSWDSICSCEGFHPPSCFRFVYAFYYSFCSHVRNTFHSHHHHTLQTSRESIHASQHLSCSPWFQSSKTFCARGEISSFGCQRKSCSTEG